MGALRGVNSGRGMYLGGEDAEEGVGIRDQEGYPPRTQVPSLTVDLDS